MASTRQIAIYGKGGIGKSTTSANLSAALSQMGEQVLQVGCDPKSDSCTTLLGGRLIPTILDTMRSEGVTEASVSACVHRGFNGILCAEAGGPRPGAGCAGKGVALALDMLSRFKLLEKYGVTFALYDVLGDVVCGGFAQPMRRGYAQEIYLVTSGELMALYAANNLAKAINLMMEEGANVSVGGIINNQRNVPGEAELMLEFSEMLGVPIVSHIPRSQLIQAAELRRRTVVEEFPDSDQAQVYRDLAQRIRDNPIRVLPRSMELADIVELLNKHQIDLRSMMEPAGSASLGCSACP